MGKILHSVIPFLLKKFFSCLQVCVYMYECLEKGLKDLHQIVNSDVSEGKSASNSHFKLHVHFLFKYNELVLLCNFKIFL